MNSSVKAIASSTIISMLFASSVMAQSQPRPTPPPQPVIIIPAPTPPPVFTESMVFGPNGQITIIKQQGLDTFVTTSP